MRNFRVAGCICGTSVVERLANVGADYWTDGGLTAPCARRGRRYAGRMTTLEPAAARIDPRRVAELAERQRAIHRERTAASGRMYERAATVMPGGVPSPSSARPVARLPQARRGLARVGRRRQRVHRLPQRLRRHVRRPRQPRHRRRRARRRWTRAPTSRRRPRARSPSPRSSAAAGASRTGASPTRAPSRRWTRSTSPARRAAATSSSRSRAPTTATTTP